MRLNLCCPECLKFSSEEPELGPATIYALPVIEGGLYRWKCEDGHDVALGLNADRFEVLFEIAIQALADGYPRECVATTTASLERFYEFYVRLIWEARDVPANVRSNLWKEVVSSSERQLGMFAATYVIETGHAPPLLTKRNVELRNRVIHKGHIPTPEEATAFTQAVADLVHPVLLAVVEKYPNAAAAGTAQQFKETLSRLHAGEHFSGWWGTPFPLSRMRAELMPCDVAELVSRRKRDNWATVAI